MTATIRNLEGQDEASILREIHSAPERPQVRLG